MLLVSTGRDGRGRGRERTTTATRLGEWHQMARWSGSGCLLLGLRALLFVPGGRQDARLGRPVVFRPVRPEWPVGAPRSVRGQPTSPASPGRSRYKCNAVAPLCYFPDCL